VIVPLWFLPLIGGGIATFYRFSWALVGLLAVGYPQYCRT